MSHMQTIALPGGSGDTVKLSRWNGLRAVTKTGVGVRQKFLFEQAKMQLRLHALQPQSHARVYDRFEDRETHESGYILEWVDGRPADPKRLADVMEALKSLKQLHTRPESTNMFGESYTLAAQRYADAYEDALKGMGGTTCYQVVPWCNGRVGSPINGAFKTRAEVLQRLTQTMVHWSHARHACHGDPTLDNAVIRDGKIVWFDPNPNQPWHPLLDYGKVAQSITFSYRDAFGPSGDVPVGVGIVATIDATAALPRHQFRQLVEHAGIHASDDDLRVAEAIAYLRMLPYKQGAFKVKALMFASALLWNY